MYLKKKWERLLKHGAASARIQHKGYDYYNVSVTLVIITIIYQ